ncbi:MlaA family lipoprotein [Roseospira goensis]|uniref:Phospholipid-binding lipoprotein MlaA n=1 Tax=Roseospira goensis TaxID=391922 RepID=A0A7W6RW65_9PROT|nr:VacJ family lipoprotein [Roseospira goensis]MBB4284363.1 phospholipid-binding lipoprotein MlaA [Roseospira goensis]
MTTKATPTLPRMFGRGAARTVRGAVAGTVAVTVAGLALTGCAALSTVDTDPAPPSAGARTTTAPAIAPPSAGNGAQLAALAQSAPDIDDPDSVDDTLVADPLEDWNRFVFDLNSLIYMFIQPVIAPYGVLPDERKENVDNFLHNLSTPVILLNDLLQGETDRAWVTTQRFAINSTAGGLGFWDAAEDMGLPKHDEDFGQTLGVWGVGDGPYIVFPLFGPGNPRDGIGRAVDMVTDPLFWLAGPSGEAAVNARTYASVSSQVGGNVNRMEELRETSIDFYAAVRSLYIQSRRAAIANDEGNPAASAPSLSETGPKADTVSPPTLEAAARPAAAPTPMTEAGAAPGAGP